MSQIHASLEMQSVLNDDGRIFFEPITRQDDSSMRKIFQMYKHEDYKFYNGKGTEINNYHFPWSCNFVSVLFDIFFFILAALIIRMLEHIVGKSIFVKALERYLTYRLKL